MAALIYGTMERQLIINPTFLYCEYLFLPFVSVYGNSIPLRESTTEIQHAAKVIVNMMASDSLSGFDNPMFTTKNEGLGQGQRPIPIWMEERHIGDSSDLEAEEFAEFES